MKNSTLPIVAFLTCALIWGSTFLVIRVGNDTLPAVWACGLRLAVAAVLLNGVLFAQRQRWPKGEALKSAVLYGVWEFGIGMPLLYWGEKVVPSGLAAVIYAVCPITAMFTARALGMEALSLRRLGAAFLSFSGVGVIFWRELARGGSLAGLVAVFLAAFSAPVAALMLQRGPKQSAVAANAVGAAVGIPTCVLGSLLLGEKMIIPTAPGEVFSVLYLAVVSSAGAFVIFAWLLNHWRTTSVAFLGVIVPLIAVVLGAVVRHEAFSAGSLVGAVIVLLGVIVALRSEGGTPALKEATDPGLT